jgi:hypothetical protein
VIAHGFAGCSLPQDPQDAPDPDVAPQAGSGREIVFGVAGLDSCNSWAAMEIAMLAGSLLAIPGMPIGQVRALSVSLLMPSRSMRERKRADLLAEPMSPNQDESPRLRIERHNS